MIILYMTSIKLDIRKEYEEVIDECKKLGFGKEVKKC